MIGFPSDNASVMMGQKGGVQAYFRNKNQHLYVMGCICHSLHLCSSAAAKTLPSILEILTRNIYTYFSHGSKRLLEFQELQELFSVKVHKILKTSSTRWLALGNVVDRILEQWVALKHYFRVSKIERNEDLGIQIFSYLTNSNEVYFAFMSYILNVTNKMNIEF